MTPAMTEWREDGVVQDSDEDQDLALDWTTPQSRPDRPQASQSTPKISSTPATLPSKDGQSSHTEDDASQRSRLKEDAEEFELPPLHKPLRRS